MTTRPRIAQLHVPLGTADGSIPKYDEASGVLLYATAAVQWCRAAFTAAGGEIIVYLGVDPIADSELVFVDGDAQQWGVDYTLSGQVLTLASPLTVGQVLLVRYSITTACGIAQIVTMPRGFTRPAAVARPPRRFHRIR
jgi:hypothetical protein